MFNLLIAAAVALIPAAVRTGIPGASASAQAASPANNALSAALRASVLDAVMSRLASTYVDEADAIRIAAAVRARQGAGAYDKITNPAQFAEAVTKDLRSVNGDLHLGLRYSKDSPVNASRAASPFDDPREINFGLGRAEILDGNVGYLEITAFAGGEYESAVVDALRFLSRTDAMIIDVRRNGGGASDMSHFIFSHFLGDKAMPTIDVRTRRSLEPQHRMSVTNLPGPRRPDVPLYLLTSQGTASAAEEFSFVLKNKHRATLVGSRTAGAGHMVAQIGIGDGFTVSLSITRVSDPQSGREWEQVGVVPDLPVAAEQALDVAHAAALKVVMASTKDAEKARTLRLLIETIEARNRAISLDANRLARFVGNYEGRTVSMRDGQLWYTRRVGGMSDHFTPLGGDVFAIGAIRYRFADSAGAVTLTIEQTDGTQVVFLRESATPKA